MRTHVIVNTTAHLYRTRPSALEELRRAAEGRAAVFATSTLTELEAACSRIAEEGTDCVALSGGDGTFMAGLTALTRTLRDRASRGSSEALALPRLALLPGGTVATVARNWGSFGPAPKLLDRLLASGHAAKTTLRPTLRVADDTGERIGFIFGTGLVARFFDVYYEAGARGYGGAARIVGRIFLESFYGGSYARRVLDPLPCWIEVDGRRLVPDAWSLVCCSVVRDLGIHMLVNYRAGEDLERPHLVASALTSRMLGPRLPLVLSGKRIGGKHHFDGLVREFTVHFAEPSGPYHDGAASGPKPRSLPGPYVLDGDILRSRSVTVSAGPPIEVVRFDDSTA